LLGERTRGGEGSGVEGRGEWNEEG